ncbi:MAG TPA: NAD(P)-binding protein [Bryobacteraceae bacterium]|jgi:choline dehydrogenase-like flavoprotein|nr:NAD(P)-binding protein [Bryobacteraceae bacterium]
MSLETIVVGSGPSGVACAWALLRAGHRVKMLDTGLHREPELSERLAQLQTVDSVAWNAAPEAAFLRKGIGADTKGIPLKLAYGSDFPYRSLRGGAEVICEDVYTRRSLAFGGLSNVWGASMLPYRQGDIGDWPVSEADLAPHYRAVLEHVPLSGREDDLRALFPLFADASPLPMGLQARNLLARLDRNRAALKEKNVFAGASRLAVTHTRGRLCVCCGLCLYGCPLNLIYCSASSVEDLKTQTNFAYVPGTYIRKAEESGGRAAAEGFDVSTGKACSFNADRIFLACGVLGTTEIALRSMRAYSTSVRLVDSQYFLQPCLALNGTRGVTKEHLHTLAQVFIEIVDETISNYTVHLQTYTYNELYAGAIDSVAGIIGPFVPKEVILSRLIVLQGYLHSHESPSMNCVLEETEAGDTLRVRIEENPRTRETIRRVQKKLLKCSALTGLIPLMPLLRIGQPGRGFHSGGSFPMNRSPSGFQSDCLGRIPGFSRVHAVDSSVFPSIPASTITLTAMANAHRIGTQAAQL